MEEVGLLTYRFDTQAFLFAAHDMDGGEFAALDTLQYGLARDAEFHRCLQHRKIAWRWILDEACPHFIGDSNLPRRSWCYLLTSYETIIKPPVNSGSVDTQDLCGLSN